MKIPYFGYHWLALIVVLLFLVGCSPDAADLALTVESQVAAAVMATQATWPTPTTPSTFTPYPTFTPQATFTPYPTLTPYPTQTPQPTYTPAPTATAMPPTETPTETAVAAAIPTNPPLPTAVSNTTTDREMLAASISSTLGYLDSYVYEISARYLGKVGSHIEMDTSVNCTYLVSAYEGIINSYPSDFLTSDEWLQAIYNSFSLQIDKFVTENQPWADGCRESLAAGQEIKSTDVTQSSMVVSPINEIISVLNQLHNELVQSN